MISGLPGTGKTTVAAALAERRAAAHVSVDPIEDGLLDAGHPRTWETGVAAYEAARREAEQHLALGSSVVVDAVNDSEPARETWRVAAANTGAELAFVLLVLDDAGEHRRRLEGRERDLAHVPEPSWDDVLVRAASYAPWPEGSCLRIRADGAVDEVLHDVLTGLPGL